MTAGHERNFPMKKMESPGTMLLCAVLFAASTMLRGHVPIRDGIGWNMAAALLFLAAAGIWFARWRRAKRGGDDL